MASACAIAARLQTTIAIDEARLRAEPIHHPAGEQEPDRVGELEREDDVGVVDLAPAELLLQRRLQDADDLPVDVVDRRRKEQQRADDPAVVAARVPVAAPWPAAADVGSGGSASRRQCSDMARAKSTGPSDRRDCGGESRTRDGRASRPPSACPEATASTSANSRSAAASSVSVSSMMPLTSRSMLSAICRAVRALPVILITGAIGIAGRRAEAGREDDHLRAAADHAGHRFDVEPRRVHHRQALAA